MVLERYERVMLSSQISALSTAAKQHHTRYGTSSHAAGTEIHPNWIAVAAIRTIRKGSTARAGVIACIPKKTIDQKRLSTELGGKEGDSLPDRGTFKTLTNEKVEGDSPHDVDDGPDRTKDPGRRVERGFVEPGIPAGDAPHREERAEHPHTEGNCNTEIGQAPGTQIGGIHTGSGDFWDHEGIGKVRNR